MAILAIQSRLLSGGLLRSHSCLLSAALLAATVCCSATAQTASPPPSPAQANPAPAPDPLAIGKQALGHGNYAAAQTFFIQYLKDNPNSADALYLNGNASLGLKQFDDATRLYAAALAKQPTLWGSHKNLVIVYAAQGKWPQFDAERMLIQQARAKNTPGLAPNESDVIDILYVGPERYIVRDYAVPAGRFHTHYNFTHFGPDGKLDSYISCESDDIDQIAFAKAHPKEAAAGQRSFSLDSYTPARPAADGKTMTQTHGTIKFYPDGEPTYETVRADVLKVLEHKAGPLSSTTINKAPAQQ